jgi:predicted RNA-binding Zn-ribbon protein involved in translation (DUF1610 family)
MAKMAGLHQEANLKGAFCKDCNWAQPNVKQVAFCPKCGTDKIGYYDEQNQNGRRIHNGHRQVSGGVQLKG